MASRKRHAKSRSSKKKQKVTSNEELSSDADFSSPYAPVLVLDYDRSAEGGWQELMGRIVRGDRIRGHGI